MENWQTTSASTTLNPSIRSDEGLTLETSASSSLHVENLTLINLLGTKF